MKITRACDYTLRALVCMARSPMNTVFMRTELAKQCCVPDSFLGKILQSLAKSDVLISERGKKGGFKLGKLPKEINIHDVLVAVDGPIKINNCMDETFDCEQSATCQITGMWQEIQEALIAKLKEYSLEDIVVKGYGKHPSQI